MTPGIGIQSPGATTLLAARAPDPAAPDALGAGPLAYPLLDGYPEIAGRLHTRLRITPLGLGLKGRDQHEQRKRRWVKGHC